MRIRDDAWSRREEQIKFDAHAAYSRHEQFFGPAAMRVTERKIAFSVINSHWREHLSHLDAMRAAANSADDLNNHFAEYREEAENRFAEMIERINEDIVGYLIHSTPDM